MALFGMGKKRSEELGEIKRMVSPTNFEIPVEEILPETSSSQISALETAPPKTAPLFVKVERYKEMLDNVQKMRTLLTDISRIISLRRDLEGLRGHTDELLQKTVEEFEGMISQIDRDLARPQSVEPLMMPSRKTDAYLADLEEELNKLQSQLRRLQ